MYVRNMWLVLLHGLLPCEANTTQVEQGKSSQNDPHVICIESVLSALTLLYHAKWANRMKMTQAAATQHQTTSIDLLWGFSDVWRPQLRLFLSCFHQAEANIQQTYPFLIPRKRFSNFCKHWSFIQALICFALTNKQQKMTTMIILKIYPCPLGV